MNLFVLYLQPETEGYVAIVLPKLQEVTPYFDKLLSSQDYNKIMEKRKSIIDNGKSR
jgi:hypothetical protein